MAYPSSVKKTNGVHDPLVMGQFVSVLRDGTPVVLRRLVPSEDTSLLAAMHELFNFEVEKRGDSYPIEDALSLGDFVSYFTAYETFVLVADQSIARVVESSGVAPSRKGYVSTAGKCGGIVLSRKDLVGCFYIKPNWPGRCSHVCNGGFLVAPAYRNQGAAFIMGERYRHLAKALGYHASMFNLVFETNLGSNKLWHRFGFTNTGRVPMAGRIRLHSGEDKAQLEEGVRAFRRDLIALRMAAVKRSTMTVDEEAWVKSPLFDFEGISGPGEAYVAALQWHLDLRKPLQFYEVPWGKRSESSKL